MVKHYGIEIQDILADSIAEELELKAGDRILTINGEDFYDILEYRFLTVDENIELEIEDKNGDVTVYEIEKEFGEDIGILFEGIIDEEKSCTNNCVFCFIDQMPPDMRSTLYFKDDDTRLSFLLGNFVTLTNLKEEDIHRIIKYRISPINVSIHTTDMDLRKEMLKNRFADKLMDYLEMLCSADIEVKGQIVLCKGINDGENLRRTLLDLKEFHPSLSCVAIVPIGLTKYREGLPEMEAFDQASAAATIQLVEEIQQQFVEDLGYCFAYMSDEFYCIAQKELPAYDCYEDFPQLENGVGLLRFFEANVEDSMAMTDTTALFPNVEITGTIATGAYAYETVKEATKKINAIRDTIHINVEKIENEFFGPLIKVAGLLTGQDLVAQLKGKNLGDNLFITSAMLKAEEPIFLDDMTVEQVEKELNVHIVICAGDGSDLVKRIIRDNIVYDTLMKEMMED